MKNKNRSTKPTPPPAFILNTNDKLSPDLQEYFDKKVKELGKPKNITFYTDNEPYFTEIDYDFYFNWVGIMPDGQILMRNNGVCMNKQTFEELVNAREINAQHGKKYEISLIIEEVSDE